ncbi:hypothetical protein [Synechococcus phage S-B68]|nr:hypothetical protein [Synechococcus phage S-B68]
MKTNQITTPSDQVDTFLPQYVVENYDRFVDFMSKSAESEERIGFGQDILQNLQKYRNFDTYKNEIVQFGVLEGNLAADTSELTLVDGYGFPEENGVLLIDDEVILYRTKEGNTFYDLQRGAPGTVVLPTLRSTGTYVQTTAERHTDGAQVTNLSVLFLVAMLDTIHDSFAPNISAARVSNKINRSNLLQNIKDFFASKGSKLGIKTLFKMLFERNDVEVSYPGDRMITPSKSTWAENTILRVEPFPEILSDPSKPYTTPEKVIGSELVFKTALGDEILGRTTCEYVSSYPYADTIQYEMYIDGDNISGDFNPVFTTLTRRIENVGVNNDEYDVYTVTVNSTDGFPDAGIFYVGNEGIKYTSKTFNQFLGCTRGYINVETAHEIGDTVYGPFYVEATITEGGQTLVSKSWPVGLVRRVTVNDPGLLNLPTDAVTIGEAGGVDPAEVALTTFDENTTYSLATQANGLPNMAFVGDRVHGVSGVYFDTKQVFVSSSNLPGYQIGPFSTDDSVGPGLVAANDVHVIPRRDTREVNDAVLQKGTGTIGVAIDGVPFYSNISPTRVTSGEITKFTVDTPGGNYINPTVLIDPPNSTAEATVVGGKITAVTSTSSGNYTEVPTVRVTTGEGAQVSLTFDNYGRITGATLVSGGDYYIDKPKIGVYDASGRGRGGLLACEISGGSITSVSVLAPGIDYNSATTSVSITPLGAGATVTATVQHYQLDRIKQIQDDANLTLDSGNGFLYEDDNGVRSQFGYAASPSQVLSALGDTPTAHSKIIGWAFDGNPIYGPYAYKNGTDASAGFEKQVSSYVLELDRSTIVASGGTTVGTLPPDTGTYPMGTFVEDYTYDPQRAAITSGRLQAEDDDFILSEGGDYVNHQTDTEVTGLLNEFNGKVCNTPEFPADLYPDGVFCYFVTNFGIAPQFPYLIGNTFKNRPITQNISWVGPNGTVTPTNQTSTYAAGSTSYDATVITRHQSDSLVTTSSDIQLSISDTTDGSISSIVVEEGLPLNSKVGDLLYFDDEGTQGQGAGGKVTFIEGVAISETSSQEIVTKLITHKQRINLRFSSDSFVFFTGMKFQTSSNAESVVVSYNATDKILDVQTTSENLIQFGDTFRDARGTSITLPSSDTAGNTLMNGEIVGGTSTFISSAVPSSEDVAPGDLWWSSATGRLYIYFNDGDTSQWVTTTPSGSRPFEGSTDLEVGNDTGEAQAFAHPQDESSVTISTLAPAARADGSPNVAGDLWWSSHTGILYMWNQDNSTTYDQGQLEWSGEWVITDPIGMTNQEGVSAAYEYSSNPAGPGATYSQSVKVLISETSPTTLDNGDALTPGVLWWSPLNGKMYIYYTDADTSQWVVTNPTGVLTGEGALDALVAGTGSLYPDVITLLPESTDQTSLWFESLNQFKVGDVVEFVSGAPGVDGYTSTAIIRQINGTRNAIVDRGASADRTTLAQGSIASNTTRALYTVTTATPHNLVPGDVVRIAGSSNTELNADHTVVAAGRVQEASGTATIAGGAVTGVTITDAGGFYPENVYVTFVGGGGVGAYGIATVATLEDGGGVLSVTITNGGVNYTSAPTVVFRSHNLDNQFSFHTTTQYDGESGLTYSSDSPLVSGRVVGVGVDSPGSSYQSLPQAIGLYKREIDRAVTKITLSGQTIGSVAVESGGNRYTAPIAVFDDLTGAGTGAEATVGVINGKVVSVTVTNPGTGYVEPVLTIVEPSGKYIALTDTIGKIRSYTVDNPGRNISSNLGSVPEIQPLTRCIVSPTTSTIGDLQVGRSVYQGTSTARTMTADVIRYEEDLQLVTLNNVVGVIQEGEVLYDEFGAEATVLVSGQSASKIVVDGISEPRGRFIDDTSKVSAKYGAIQDSEYFQWFSYSISSPLQQVQYETFVRDIVHPAGFQMFSDVLIADSSSSTGGVEEALVDLE